MCGIIGYIGHQQVQNILIDGLHRLEYRGYDSAGIAVLEDGHIGLRKKAAAFRNWASWFLNNRCKAAWALATPAGRRMAK